jgi:two-component system NtrC family sensor kinase
MSEQSGAEKVLQRMWWLGQQITLELDPRRVVERFLEAAGDVAEADGASLGLVTTDGIIEITAASGALATCAGLRLPVTESVMGRIIRGAEPWSVADADEHRDELHETWFRHSATLGTPMHAVAIVPVQRRGERIGAVTIASARREAFTPLQLERVEAMSDLLSVALANAELFETMRQAEWRFRTLFRAAPDAVLTVLQTTGRVREANDAVREVFGLDPHQVVGRSLIDLVAEDDRANLERVLVNAFAGAPGRTEVQVVHPDQPDAPRRFVALAASRLPEADPPSALLVGRDMTHEREMHARLMESDRLAAVGELVAGVAHEVNNPLSSISAFARRSEPQRVPLDLNAVIARSLRMRQYQFDETGVRVETELADDLPSVMGDGRQLQQVCLNLLTNAIQAMSAGGGTLRVRSARAGDAVRLDIADSGPGVAEHVRQHIFEPFFTTKKEGEGTGLGLSVSYGIVAAHGGTLELVETGPQGTTFRVNLPAGDSPALAQEAARDQPAIALRSPIAGIRLLFVDDEPALRNGMKAYGDLRGFTVLTAADGSAALETTRSVGVDAIVCDLRMPGMDGIAFHEQLRQERPGLAARTVFITGDVVTSVASRGSVARQPVLTKPFVFDRIEEAVIAVMKGQAYRRS